MNKFFTFFVCLLLISLTVSVKVEAQNDCSYWQQRDSSFGYVPNTSGTAPYYRNDDGSTNPITLPFKFCFWGTEDSVVYINNNGNITFGAGYSPFSPDTFPNTTVPAMIAPYWGDVDTRGGTGGTDAVIYKITPHYMIVQWDSVGYYAAHTNLTCSFQLIISDGTDPIIPLGNNVLFTYKQMQWTTGDASGGVGGFGTYPSNVGANEGDGVRAIQIGLFDNAGATYLGQYPPAPNFDGVAWLNNKSFLFNLCSGTVAPLVSGISPCDTFRLCLGDSALIPIYFLAAIQGDTVWSNIFPPIPAGVSVYGSYPGSTDSLIIKIVGTTSNYGYHTINVYGYDNEVPSDTTFVPFVIEIDSAPTNIHLLAYRDTICAGDTSRLSATGGTYYNWSTGATTSAISVEPTTTQVYTVSISDGGCYKDTTIQVNVLPAPNPSITAIPDTVCANDSVLLIASGTGTFTWSTGQTKDSIWVRPSTDSTFILYASNGFCADFVSKRVYIRAKVTAVASIRDSVVCPHDTSYLTVTASGGTATYKWSNGATSSSILVTDTVTTTYTATVYGICDSLKLIKTVTVIPLPKPFITGSSWKCRGIRDTIKITGGASYLWSNGDTTSTYFTGPIDGDSTVYVTTKNSLGCSVTDSFQITLRVVPNITITSPKSACSGDSVSIVASATGTGPFTYSWTPGGETSSTISVQSPQDSTTTTYTVTVSNGCSTSKTTTITAEYPVLYTIGTQTLIIENDTTVLWASGNSVDYTWEDSNQVVCLNPPLCDSVRVTPTVTTTYTVTGVDKLGCFTTGYVTVVIDIPCLDFTVPNVFTPNYTGPNGKDNKFYIKTDNINSWSIQIFDRWGKEMYKSNNVYNYWDGTNESGEQAPDGVYYYVINGVCQSKTYKKQGFVQLIR